METTPSKNSMFAQMLRTIGAFVIDHFVGYLLFALNVPLVFTTTAALAILGTIAQKYTGFDPFASFFVALFSARLIHGLQLDFTDILRIYGVMSLALYACSRLLRAAFHLHEWSEWRHFFLFAAFSTLLWGVVMAMEPQLRVPSLFFYCVSIASALLGALLDRFEQFILRLLRN